MKCQLYCIFATPQEGALTVPEGLNCNLLRIVGKHGLSAVIGDVSDTGAAHDATAALAYHKVIVAFHDQVAVVPFRFGTVLDEQADAERLLVRKADLYTKLLHELEGCSEMGIRVITEEPRQAMLSRGAAADLIGPSSTSPGTGYLARRTMQYQQAQAVTQADERAEEHYRSLFDGLFRKCRSEASRSARPGSRVDSVMRSLYFLVPKESLLSFRQTFVEVAARDAARLLLSGPWPPYNFVLPAERSDLPRSLA